MYPRKNVLTPSGYLPGKLLRPSCRQRVLLFVAAEVAGQEA
jgi:hypothetical protein